MLQRLMDVRPRIFCDSAHGAITEIVQQLLVTGHPTVELVSKSSNGSDESAHSVFDRVRNILIQAHFLDTEAPVSEARAGLRAVRIPNPHHGSLHVPVRIRLGDKIESAAILLHTFLVLRIRYQITTGSSPLMRIEASATSEAALDALYLTGDAFTERYPVAADIVVQRDRVVLTLTGQPPLITGGLAWARDDYVRSRDASLLIRPLREALDGPMRPLVVPREALGSLGVVRVRLPKAALERTKWLRWLSSLQELGHPVGGNVMTIAGQFGDHLSVAPTDGGYIAAGGSIGTEAILPVRCILQTAPVEVIVPEAEDGSVAISLEALGGAREIGANCYYYAFGRLSLVVDAGYDATRDGWLGLPAFERLPRLDAVILTHAHLDHVGALPALVAAFPNVPIYCTRATLAVVFPQLTDSANVGNIRFGQTGEAPALSHGLVDNIRVDQFRLLDYRVRSELPEIPGLALEFYDAGHIIGSACAKLEFCGISILHTGDISVEDQHLLRGMPVDELKADHVVMEGTYCGEPDFTRADRRAAVTKFLSALAERLDAGGSVLVPAFSLGRAQELVGMLVDWNKRTHRSVPIWTVGMVNKLNDVSAANPSFLPGLSGNPFAQVRPFPLSKKKNATEEERRIEHARVFFDLAQQAPCVVIASHGMMTEGTGSYLIGRAILMGDDPRHAIFLCGYMDPRTPGFRLRYQRKDTVIDFGAGDAITRRIPADQIQFHRLTAHASYEELVEVALRTARRSVTFIHGDGKGLDELIADLRGRARSHGQGLTFRAPAIGERMLVDRARPPEGWDLDAPEPPDTPPTLGPGRKFDRESGLSLRGLAADWRWALIPVGRPAVNLALDHDRIDTSRIERVDLRPERGESRVVFDRARGEGDLGRLMLDEPGKFTWLIDARDPNGQLIRASFTILCGVEARPVRTALDAALPVIEIEVGGRVEPRILDASSGRNGSPIKLEDQSWDPAARLLRIRLRPYAVLGSIDDVHLRLRWPNGFVQSEPSIGSFTLEPRVDFESPSVRVGTPAFVRLRSEPVPIGARIGGQPARWGDDRFHFVPKRPGLVAVELEYETLSGGREWREVGTVDVKPAAYVDLPTEAQIGSTLDLTVGQVHSRLWGAELVLRVGGEIRDRWTASSDLRRWSGAAGEAGPLEISVHELAAELTLWSGTVRVYGGIEFDLNRSMPVTAADGSLEAELAFPGSTSENRLSVEKALSNAGFILRDWRDNTLRVLGKESTMGSRVVSIVANARRIEVRILTLPDLCLRLTPSGPLHPGDSARLRVAGAAITAAMQDTGAGPLVVEAERVEPLIDLLSTRVIGDRVHFLHVGTYTVALVSSGRRLAHVTAQILSLRRMTAVAPAVPVERTATSAYDASVFAAQCPPCASTAILARPGEPYRVMQEGPSRLDGMLWDFLTSRLAALERVLISWPGLALGEIAGRVLRRLRVERPQVSVAHLSYPAPRGDVVSDEVGARLLRGRRVLCYARADSTIDRQDAYFCPTCSGSPRLRTDTSRIWQQCQNCGHTDRELVLTLAELRSTEVQVLFADFRIARYLSRGSGRRYAGAFGRSVRCSNCHGLQIAFPRATPWERTELRRLLRAIGETWDQADEAGSVRRAAYVAARRAHLSRPSDISRLEDAMRRLIDSGVVKDGRAVGEREVGKLEAGLSLCCERNLVWSSSRFSCIFLEVEELLNPAVPSSLHPELLFGQAGVRELLTLAE